MKINNKAKEHSNHFSPKQARYQNPRNSIISHIQSTNNEIKKFTRDEFLKLINKAKKNERGTT